MEEDGDGDHGDLRVGGVKDLPHRRHDVVVLQPDEQAPVLLASLKQNLIVLDNDVEEIVKDPTSSLRARDLSVSRV